VPRPSPGLEQLQPGDHVVLYNGREVIVVRIIRRSQDELQIFCE
jgi:predicted RNA-binding protein